MIWNMINTFLALASLLAAIYSILYAHRYNRYIVDIEESYYSEVADHLPKLYQFDIFNNSLKGIFIRNVVLFDGDDNPIPFDINFQPAKGTEVIYEAKYAEFQNPFGENQTLMLEPELSVPTYYEHQNPFKRKFIVPANGSVTLSYYLDINDTDLKIKITADKKLSWFSKTKSFNVQFDKLD